MQAVRAVQGAGDSPTKDHNQQGVPCRDTALFQDPPEDCICPIGKGVMTDPLTILVDDCEHEFCSGCLRRMLGSADRSECPQCRRVFHARDLRCLRRGRLRVLELDSHCDNREKGCQWTGKYGALDAHLRECEHATLYRCPFWHYGCGYVGPSEEVDHHLLMDAQEHLRLTCQRLSAYGDDGEFQQQPNAEPIIKASGGLTDDQVEMFKDGVTKVQAGDMELEDLPELFRQKHPDVAWSVLRCLKADNQQFIQSCGLVEIAYGFYTWTLISNKL
eukprot:TRINITY_DN5211_c0_g2_i1.p1 TRINITY_DN5211_c0_g2~~TRINITY_DN5211_c0_g2_i1.p1  ORF type:complete len:302 (+),score=92.97 TRINITY_DN5211_c0_g2_i1:85-906(+)